MDASAHPIRGSSLERCEQPIRGDDLRVRGQHHPTAQLTDVDAAEVQRRPSTAGDTLDRRPVDLDLADPHLPAARDKTKSICAQ